MFTVTVLAILNTDMSGMGRTNNKGNAFHHVFACLSVYTSTRTHITEEKHSCYLSTKKTKKIRIVKKRINKSSS